MAEIQVVDFRSDNAPAVFARSLRETGFGVIAHHPIDQQLIEKNYQDWAQFFHSDEKHQFEFNKETHSGYVSTELSETAKGNDKKDLKEFFHFYEWSDCPEVLRASTSSMMQQLIAMAKTLLSWVNQGLPDEVRAKLSMPLGQMLEGSRQNLLRILHYPPLRGDEPEGAVRAAAHEDINLITLLPAATAEGLQAKMTNGQWLDVPIDPNWIIINAGDMLHECTEGFYPSTSHRVLNPTGDLAKQSRLSMPCFLHPQADVRLSERHTADSYRWERFKELGLT